MKSLEIVDDLLFDFLDDAIDESATFVSKGELEQIKQDLLVLKILRKHQKDIRVRPRFSNLKDLHRLKQWLEENE